MESHDAIRTRDRSSRYPMRPKQELEPETWFPGLSGDVPPTQEHVAKAYASTAWAGSAYSSNTTEEWLKPEITSESGEARGERREASQCRKRSRGQKA
jgi:hypothetical protein